jgi:NAD(P)-dependent dehydrogenase (short-subunit alcohol dehydrogenase family)
MKKAAFITGASSGIGYELALLLVEKGYSVSLVARRADLLEQLVEKIRDQGGDAVSIACDVTKQPQIREAVAKTAAHFGGVDLAILSAGVSEPTDALHFNAAKIERILRTNLFGVMYCLEELIPIMKSQGRGIIAGVSSLAGDRGMPGSAGYCATKAALSTLFEGMRVELRSAGVRLVTIEPGYVLTPMTEKFGNMPFLMRADEAASIIFKRIEQGDRVIRFPLMASAAMRLMRFLPVSLFDVIAAKRRPVRLNG